MKSILERIYLRKLKAIFHNEQDALTVANWVRSLDGKRPVVIVGAGFSRNALRGGAVPLWRDITERLESLVVGLERGRITDPLTLAEYAWEADANTFIRTLRSMIPDADLVPGAAHEALFSYPCCTPS